MMTKAKHTPGPWHMPLETDAGDDRYLDTRDRSVFVPIEGPGCACGAIWMAGENKEQREANARLIAAAPDLLAACEAVLKYSRNGSDRCPLCGMLEGCREGFIPCPQFKVRAAIARATGKTD